MDLFCDGVPQRATADAATDLNATGAISPNASWLDECGRSGLGCEAGFPILQSSAPANCSDRFLSKFLGCVDRFGFP
jgi:hypothetical protein